MKHVFFKKNCENNRKIYEAMSKQFFSLDLKG